MAEKNIHTYSDKNADRLARALRENLRKRREKKQAEKKQGKE